jgi:hypothetical protein
MGWGKYGQVTPLSGRTRPPTERGARSAEWRRPEVWKWLFWFRRRAFRRAGLTYRGRRGGPGFLPNRPGLAGGTRQKPKTENRAEVGRARALGRGRGPWFCVSGGPMTNDCALSSLNCSLREPGVGEWDPLR